MSKIYFSNGAIWCLPVKLAGLPAISLAHQSSSSHQSRFAARFVANLRPRDHVSDVLLDLHWLPIRERISYKVCLMMFNVVNGTAPTYMNGMVTRISNLPGRCHHHHGMVSLSMFEPFAMLSHLNQHSKLFFSVSLRYIPLTILSFCGLFLFNV